MGRLHRIGTYLPSDCLLLPCPLLLFTCCCGRACAVEATLADVFASSGSFHKSIYCLDSD